MKLIVCAVLAALGVTLISGQCLSENEADSTFNRDSKTKLYAGQQEFTLSMLAEVNKATPNENVFFSSYSVFHALLLAYFGSNGQTETSLKNILRLNWTANKFEVMQAYRMETSMRMKRSKNSSVDFRTADRLFFDQSVRVKECIEDYFANEITAMDFKNKPAESVEAVNAWIEEKTNGQIKDVLNAGDITEATKAVLANAAYLKGSWESKFDIELTKDEIFYTPTLQSFVRMMKKESTFNYGVNEVLGAHVLQLPYLGGENDISFYLFLPPFAVENGIEKMLSKLTLKTFEQAIRELSAREVELKLPKMSFEKTLKIVPILKKMGVGDVFESTGNFSGFAEEEILFDDATHKAKIIVDEEGSTASAATVLFSFRSSRPLEAAQFHCNHPFMFVIYDQRSRAVLFTGIFRGPEL